MPIITPTTVQSIGRVTANQTTLDGTDSFVYADGVTKYLYLRNPTAGALSPVLDGADAVSEYVPDIGIVSTASGFAVGSIAAGAMAVVDLSSIKAFLKGKVVVTGGTGLVAVLSS